MKKNVKSIQGNQIVPIPKPGPECIRVTKIYDWVVLTSRTSSNVRIPEECLARLDQHRAEGNAITAVCTEVVKSRCCDLIGSVPYQYGPEGSQLVTLAFHVQIRVQFLSNGVPIQGCKFVTPVSFVEEVILCYPEGTDINCQIFEVQCNVLMNRMVGDMVVLKVVICPTVRVEAEVALQVDASFCSPRQVEEIIESSVECTFPGFPQSCSTFPRPSTEVQGAAEYTGLATISYIEGAAAVGGVSSRAVTTTTPTGEVDLAILVGGQCNISDSNLQINFLDTISPTPLGTPDDDLDQSFSFTASEFNQPTLVGTNGLTVNGRGVFRPAGGVAENATFIMNMTQVLNANSFTITITSASAIVTIALAQLSNPGLLVEVQPCLS